MRVVQATRKRVNSAQRTNLGCVLLQCVCGERAHSCSAGRSGVRFWGLCEHALVEARGALALICLRSARVPVHLGRWLIELSAKGPPIPLNISYMLAPKLVFGCVGASEQPRISLTWMCSVRRQPTRTGSALYAPLVARIVYLTTQAPLVAKCSAL